MAIRRRGQSWQADALVNGVRVRRQFKTAAEAEAFEASDKTPERLWTLGDAFSMTKKTRWADCKTDFMFEMATKVLESLGGTTPLTRITGSTVLEYVTELRDQGLSPATINRRLAALSSMLTTAVDAGWLKAKPKIKLLKEPKGRNRFLTEDEERELQSVLVRFNKPIADLCVVLADTGLRVSEAIGMRWRDITAKDVVVHGTKNGESRRVPLSRRAAEVIQAQDRSGTGPFHQITRDRVSKVFAKAKARTSMKDDPEIVPHILRHTCASRLIQGGAPTLVVKEWLGHKSMVMLERYAHLTPATLVDYVGILNVTSGK